MAFSGVSAEQLFEIKLLFLRELADGLKRAHQDFDAIKKHADKDTLKSLRNFFHKIAGTADSIQIPMASALAAICEKNLDTVLAGGKLDDALFHLTMAQGLSGLSTIMSQINQGQNLSTPEPVRNFVSALPMKTQGNQEEISRVLIVDDDEVSARLVRDCLRNAGFISTVCCNPKVALSKLKEELPDLVILDVVMPGIDGFELCRQLRAHPGLQFTPIIFVTRKDDVDQKVLGLEAGGNDYISKPFEPRELVSRVRSHLQRLASLQETVIRDGLTQCFNHKYFKTRLNQEIDRSKKYQSELVLAMVDCDRFKEVNDQFGHMVGDRVLVQLSKLIIASVRSTDVVARYGGDEFAILLVNAGLKEAQIITERMRERIAQYRFIGSDEDTGHEHLPVSISVGCTQLRLADNIKSFIERADSLLYKAKESGRNCVTTGENT